MAKQFNEWLDEFIDNGFDSENIGHWPEEGSEPVVVEELPEDPQFGKVYAIETSGETTYYTIDVNGDWINLTEGGQGGGIIEVEYLSEATEPNVTYRVTIGDGEYGAGLYYSMLDDYENLIFISIDDLSYVDSSGAIVLEELGDVLKRASGDVCYMNIDGGQQSSDTYYPYYYSSDSTQILDAIYPYVNEWQKTGAYYLSSGGTFSTPSEGAILIPYVQSSNETYYEEIGPINSSEQILIYNNPYTSEIEFSSGEFDLWYNNGSGFVGANGYDNMEDILTDMYGNSEGAFTSGMVYYPQVNASSGQNYSASSTAFMSLIAPQAHSDGRGWVPDGYDWNLYIMQPGINYQIVESSGRYSLSNVGGPGYFTSESDVCPTLNESIHHEVSSGDVFDLVYYPTLSSGDRFYHAAFNDKNGIWICAETNDIGHSVDGDTIYGYSSYPLGFYNNTQRVSDENICKFLTIAKTGKNGFDSVSDSTFWSRANKIFYPINSSGTKYGQSSWINNVANVILYHSLNNSTYEYTTGTFTSGQLAYMEFYSSGQYARIDTVNLPTTSTPVTVTIDGVSYTITKNE